MVLIYLHLIEDAALSGACIFLFFYKGCFSQLRMAKWFMLSGLVETLNQV